MSDALVKYITKRVDYSNEHRSREEGDWLINMERYMNRRTTPWMENQFWTRNDPIGDDFRQIEVATAINVTGLFSKPNAINVVAPTIAGTTYESAIRELFRMYWRRDDFFPKTIEGIKMAHIVGSAFLEVTWAEEVENKVVLDFDPNDIVADGERIGPRMRQRTEPSVKHRGPRYEYQDPFMFWPDPSGLNRFAVKKFFRPVDYLEAQNRMFGGALYPGLPALKRKLSLTRREASPDAKRHGLTGHLGAGSHPRSGAAAQEIMSRVLGERRADPDSVMVTVFWGWVDPVIKSYTRDEDPTQWRLVVLGEDEVVLRDWPAPSPNRLPPYVMAKAVPVPGMFYGRSALNWTLSLSELRSFIENARREEVLLNLHQQTIMDERAAVSPLDMYHRPGGFIKLRNPSGRPLRELFELVPRRDVLPSAFQESGVKEQQMDKVFGTPDPVTGTPAGSRTTAFEIGIIAQNAMNRHNLTTMALDDALFRKSLDLTFRLMQLNMTHQEVVQTAPDRRFAVDFSALEYPIDIYVDSGLFGPMEQIRLAMLERVYSMLAPVAPQYLKHGAFAEKLAARAGEANPQLLVKSDDEVRAEQAEQLQQLRRQALEEAELQAGLDTNKAFSAAAAKPEPAPGASGREGGGSK